MKYRVANAKMVDYGFWGQGLRELIAVADCAELGVDDDLLSMA